MPARRDAPTVRIDHRFAVFLDEWTGLRQGQNIEHHFRRSAKRCSPRRDDDRTVDENRKLEHSPDEHAAIFAAARPKWKSRG